METQKVDLFFATHGSKFPADRMALIYQQLQKLDDSKFTVLQSMPFSDPVIMLVVSLLVGVLGVDRMLLGQVGLGILKLITFGGLGIWAFVDWFLIMNMTRDYNYKKFQTLTVQLG